MKLISIQEAAGQLKKSRQWVWFLIRTNQLPATKVGKFYVINQRDIEKLYNKVSQPTIKNEEVSNG